jgi:L-seryl-tRNA(Ser) seleniumtransferase
MSSASGTRDKVAVHASIPSVDRLLRAAPVGESLARHGRALTLETMRVLLDEIRAGAHPSLGAANPFDEGAFGQLLAARLAALLAPSQRRVLNLTGTILHTNLGRALLPESAIRALADAASAPTNLEYDLALGRRGERDRHVSQWLCRLTGAESATVVNNNAAAVLLMLNTLGPRREVIVSRGELIEIGGAFRIPDIMARAGCRLIEIGTTNRTHLSDYAQAIGPRTAALMKVHTSNYEIRGFTASVGETALASLAREHGLPLISDLGSGTLVDLERYGLPHEPTAREMIARGVDLVSFSGDKLLGGPQAGMIVGRADLVARLNRNPMKRALRVDKLRLAALEAVLRLYTDPDRLATELPALRLLGRPADAIHACALALQPALEAALGDAAEVRVVACHSQIGSGALPADLLPSHALAIRPRDAGRHAGRRVEALAAAFRALPLPLIGRIQNDELLFDLRALEDPGTLTDQLQHLRLPVARR